MPLLAAAAWAGALGARWGGWWVPAGALLLALVAAGIGRRRDGRRTVVGATLVLAAVAAVMTLRIEQVERSPVAELAADGAAVQVVGAVSSDPRRTDGRYGPVVLVRLDVSEVTGRGATYTLSAPVLVIADPAWESV